MNPFLGPSQDEWSHSTGMMPSLGLAFITSEQNMRPPQSRNYELSSAATSERIFFLNPHLDSGGL